MYFRSARSRSLFILASTLGDIGDNRWTGEGGNVKRNKHVGEGGNVIRYRDSQHYANGCKRQRGNKGIDDNFGLKSSVSLKREVKNRQGHTTITYEPQNAFSYNKSKHWSRSGNSSTHNSRIIQ